MIGTTRGTIAAALAGCLVLTFAVLALGLGQAARPDHPVPKAVLLQPNGTGYVSIVGGPPESVTMESGYVVVMPSKSGEKHSSKQYEEVLVVYAGTGEMRITGGPVLPLKAYSAAYCPPQTEHVVVNVGREPLRYVYVAAKTR
jgi:mannose-6-phosphate isomerase-like protein (cupin superfamily)